MVVVIVVVVVAVVLLVVVVVVDWHGLELESMSAFREVTAPADIARPA